MGLVAGSKPSSAVRKTVLLICRDLRGFLGVFLHYILDKFGVLGQAEAEVGEQEGDTGVGLGHGAQAQGEHAFGAFAGCIRNLIADEVTGSLSKKNRPHLRGACSESPQCRSLRGVGKGHDVGPNRCGENAA